MTRGERVPGAVAWRGYVLVATLPARRLSAQRGATGRDWRDEPERGSAGDLAPSPVYPSRSAFGLEGRARPLLPRDVHYYAEQPAAPAANGTAREGTTSEPLPFGSGEPLRRPTGPSEEEYAGLLFGRAAPSGRRSLRGTFLRARGKKLGSGRGRGGRPTVDPELPGAGVGDPSIPPPLDPAGGIASAGGNGDQGWALWSSWTPSVPPRAGTHGRVGEARPGRSCGRMEKG